MRRIILTVLTGLALMAGLTGATLPAASASATVSPCGFPNIAYIQETFGAYAVGATGNGNIGDKAIEVAKPGWELCLYQHPDGNYNIYLYNGDELASNNSDCDAVVVKAAGAQGTTWSLQADGSHYAWVNRFCSGPTSAFLAGTDSDAPLTLCGNPGPVCSEGYYINWSLVYTTAKTQTRP